MVTEKQARDYESMSRDELVALIGGDIDPAVHRADLVLLAKVSDDSEDSRLG